MAQSPDQVAGQKRGPGRPPKTAPPALKKQKTAASTNESTPQRVTPIGSPAPEKKIFGPPAKIADSKPLPVLAEPQALGLSDSDYQTIAASAVLAASLDRSRQAWIQTGIFERYWVKPETGKNARPPPPNNPDIKTMKNRGRCRLRIEPHIFEVELYVVDKPKPPPPPKQYVPPVQPNQGVYGQPYRPGQAYAPPAQPLQNQYYQNRILPPMNPPASLYAAGSPLPPMSNQPSPQPAPPPAQPTPPPAAQDKKPSPDPVISMLATRASSDPELKALMKEVATGKANQDQLRVFQKHIDELTAVIQQKKLKEEEEERKRAAEQAQIQFEAAATARQTIHQPPLPLPPPLPYGSPHQSTPPYALPKQQPQPWVPPPPPPPSEVVFGFTAPGASEDRFLFPQYSILEALSAQHVLASFVVVRKGREAVDATGLDPDKEYWQPITLMVEVAYGRENILKDVTRWVKPAEEVKEYMKSIMARCKRAPDMHLALRLPFKASVVEGRDEDGKGGTPASITEGKKETMKPPPPPALKKKASSFAVKDNEQAKNKGKKDSSKPADGSAMAAVPAASTKEAAPETAKDGGTDASAADADGGRTRRSTRKSVRYSEGGS